MKKEMIVKVVYVHGKWINWMNTVDNFYKEIGEDDDFWRFFRVLRRDWCVGERRLKWCTVSGYRIWVGVRKLIGISCSWGTDCFGINFFGSSLRLMVFLFRYFLWSILSLFFFLGFFSFIVDWKIMWILVWKGKNTCDNDAIIMWMNEKSKRNTKLKKK
jgi:hypothetical protein